MVHFSEFNIDFKNSNEETRPKKSKILATEEVAIHCFNFNTARTHRVESGSEVRPVLMFIKVTKF